MRYFDDLKPLYAFYPALASSGPTDEQLRIALENAEDIVDADLTGLGYETPITSPEALPQVRRLVIFRTLADILPASLPGLARESSPTVANYYEQKYRDELASIAKNPTRLKGAKRIGQPEKPRFTSSRLPPRESLSSRVRRWLRP